MYYGAILITILSNIFYHISQKSINGKMNPLFSLIITYLIALFCSMIMYFVFPNKTGIMESFKLINWATIGVGLSIVGLELGFLLIYRFGGNISNSAIIVTSILALVLLPIGVFFYKENLQYFNIIGIVLCIIGVFFINKK